MCVNVWISKCMRVLQTVLQLQTPLGVQDALHTFISFWDHTKNYFPFFWTAQRNNTRTQQCPQFSCRRRSTTEQVTYWNYGMFFRQLALHPFSLVGKDFAFSYDWLLEEGVWVRDHPFWQRAAILHPFWWDFVHCAPRRALNKRRQTEIFRIECEYGGKTAYWAARMSQWFVQSLEFKR